MTGIRDNLALMDVAVVGFGNEAAAAARRLSTLASSMDLIAVWEIAGKAE